MSTPETIRSEIKGLRNLQRKKGGITLSKLCAKQEVLIETNDFMYNLVMLGNKEFTVETGAPLFKKTTRYNRVVAHHSRLKFDMEDWIGHGMRVIIHTNNGPSVMIGEVKSAVVKGFTKDGISYSAEVWD